MKVVLVDVNPRMVEAFRAVFGDDAHVSVVQGSILAQAVDAWVSPTNARAEMSGGVDAVIKRHLGAPIQKRVQQAIKRDHGGALQVGYATCVPTGRQQPAWLISTPTMAAAQPIRDTLNVALACCAAFQAVVQHNEQHAAQIVSMAVPGLGAGTGQVPVEACAELMYTAYQLFHRHYFDDFASMRATLEAELGAMDPKTSSRDAATQLRTTMSTREKAPASTPGA